MDWKNVWYGLIISQIIAIGSATIVEIVMYFVEHRVLITLYPFLMAVTIVGYLMVVVIVCISNKFNQ